MFSSKKVTPLPRTIALITDFGLSDPYVGQMKAVFARKVPHCPVVDISHHVAPFNVAQAGFFLAASYQFFANDAVFLSVVDPGVGSERKIIGVTLDEQTLIAPDNGLLGLAMRTTKAEEIRAFDLSNAINALENVSNTFHGRDVFAPLTAWIAHGGDLAGLGQEIETTSLVSSAWNHPDLLPGYAHAHVLHIDRFGNCVLNLESGSLDSPKALHLTTPNSGALTYATTYSDVPAGAPILLEGSQGFLEIAVNQQSAAEKFNLSMGDAVELKWEA